ncbi:MAG: AtpZ/AtpI family protein [Asticcacaulis sp.]|nr:AtpZ/AtpI family protein [Asticcacaulis sp.]
MLTVTDEPPYEPLTDDELKDLDDRLRAAEARQRKTVDAKAEIGTNQGLQVLGELVGGILGGLGLGWLVDHYLLGSTPWGMIAGALLGMVASVYLVVKRSAS